MDNHKIDQWAKEALQEREILPSSRVWETLERNLDQDIPKESLKPKRPNLTILSVLFLGFIGIFGYLTFSGLNDQKEVEIPYTQEIMSPVEAPSEKNAGQATSAPTVTEEKMESQENQRDEHLSEKKVIVNKKPFGKVRFLPSEKLTPVQKTENNPGVQKKESGYKPEEKVYAMNDIRGNTMKTVSDASSGNPESSRSVESIASSTIKVDAKSLLDEVQQDMATSSKKYKVDPKELLRIAEKENNETFLRKMFKTVSETSTSVIAMVNNRNVEP